MTRSPDRSVRLAAVSALALATIAAYAGIFRAGFLNLDDPVYVLQNPHVRAGVTLDGLAWALRATEGGSWHPLTWMSHMLDAQVFGLRAWGHHATSLALHVGSAVLLLLALDRLTRSFWPSALVAALFALHPLHVESVAWVSERKDVLSTLFWMLILLAYARHAERPSPGRFALVVGLFVLGLMSKPMLVTLPCVLLLLDAWPLGRTRTSTWAALVREKAVLFALAAAASTATYLAQRSSGAVAPSDVLTLPVRASNALVSCLRYLQKTVWPVDLAVYYPHPRSIELGPAVAALLVLLGITVVVVRERRRRPHLLVGWLWFLGTLVPVIGIVQVGAQAMADRYTYVPLIGVFVMAAWSLRGPARLVGSAAALGVLALALGTRRQVEHWASSRSLFEHTLEVTRENAIAEKCLGDALIEAGDLDGAIAHLTEATRIAPTLVDAHNNLGAALGARGRFEEALVQYRAELAARPRSAETHYNLGFALVSLGRVEEGIAAYEEALRIDPDLSDAHCKLGIALGTQGRFTEAQRHFEAELALSPRSAEILYDLGFALVNQGRIEEGIARYEEALRIDPGHFRAHGKLGIALGSQGKLDLALEHLQAALSSGPDDAETRRWVAITLTLKGEVERAIGEYRRLLEADPNDLDALCRIAWIRATHPDPAHRNGNEAVALAERARDLEPRPSAPLFETLGAAYAESGRFEEAVAACERAIEIGGTLGRTQEVETYRAQLARYRAREPFHLN